MYWRDDPIDFDNDDKPMFKGLLGLYNDKNDFLASVLWFFDDGPFYAHCVDLNEPDIIRRIGPCTTLEDAKDACMRGIEGKIKDLNKRAGYPRGE